MAEQVLPSQLRLTAPPTLPQARSYLFKQKSTLTDYSSRSVITINIPRLQRTYLSKESYLRFDLEIANVVPGYALFTSAGAVGSNAATDLVYPNLNLQLDTPGAASLIDRIEVYDYLGSTLLESTAGYAQLCSLMNDTLSSPIDSGFTTGATEGTLGACLVAENDISSTQPRIIAPTSGQSLLRSVADYGIAGVTAMPVLNPASTAGAATKAKFQEASSSTYSTTITREFAIPLKSFLGNLSSKYAPLHNGFTINITLNNFDLAISRSNKNATATPNVSVLGTIGTIKIKDVNFCAQVLELGPVAESMLLSSTGGQPLIVPTKAYRNYVGSLPVSATSFRLDMGLNVASLTSILWMMRDNDVLISTTDSTFGQRIRNYLQNWNFQYGSSVLPQTSGIAGYGPQGALGSKDQYGYTEAYVELMKAVKHWGSGVGPACISATSFNRDAKATLQQTPAGIGSDKVLFGTNTGTACELPKFACGLSLELVPGKDMICGLNTNGMNTSINANFRSDKSGSIKGCQIDAWAEYDSFINVSPGLATTVSF